MIKYMKNTTTLSFMCTKLTFISQNLPKVTIFKIIIYYYYYSVFMCTFRIINKISNNYINFALRNKVNTEIFINKSRAKISLFYTEEMFFGDTRRSSWQGALDNLIVETLTRNQSIQSFKFNDIFDWIDMLLWYIFYAHICFHGIQNKDLWKRDDYIF